MSAGDHLHSVCQPTIAIASYSQSPDRAKDTRHFAEPVFIVWHQNGDRLSSLVLESQCRSYAVYQSASRFIRSGDFLTACDRFLPLGPGHFFDTHCCITKCLSVPGASISTAKYAYVVLLPDSFQDKSL